MHRVAITGIGIVSCIGNNIQKAAESLRLGKSGIAIDEERINIGFRSPLTGVIRDFKATDFLTRKQRKTMADFTIHAYASVREALDMSGLSDEEVQGPDTGLIFGCDSSCIAAV